MYSYATIDALKTIGSITGTGDDAQRRRLLEAASEEFDKVLRRTFRTYLDTYYLSPEDVTSVLLDREITGLGLLSVTTLKTDRDGDRVYETTWATTDYDLLPLNAANQKKPFWEIAKAPNGVQSFPKLVRGLEIVGKWGYFEDLVRVTSLLNGALTAAAVSVVVDNEADFEVLQTILVDSEQMYITAVTTDSSHTLTVERGVNGTTAASHLDDAVIDRYRYPPEISEACMYHASRLWTRRASGYADVVGFDDGGTTRPWQGFGRDVKDLIEKFRLEGSR